MILDRAWEGKMSNAVTELRLHAVSRNFIHAERGYARRIDCSPIFDWGRFAGDMTFLLGARRRAAPPPWPRL